MKTGSKFHQGDVQGVVIEKLPQGVISIEKKKLAGGSNSHVITGDYKLFEKENFRYAVIGEKGAILQHVKDPFFCKYDTTELLQTADHNPIKLDAGDTIKLGIHKRYDSFSKVWANVLD